MTAKKTFAALTAERRHTERLIAETRLRFYRVTTFLHITDTANPPARWNNAMLDATAPQATTDTMNEALDRLQSLYERATGLTGI